MISALFRATGNRHRDLPSQLDVTVRKVESYTGLPTPIFNVRLVVSNASLVEVQLTRVDAEATCQGLPVGVFSQGQGLTIPARSEAEVGVTYGMLSQLQRVVLSRAQVKWEIQATCHFKAGEQEFRVTKRLHYSTENHWG